MHRYDENIIKFIHKWLKFRKHWTKLSLGSVPDLSSFGYVYQ